MLPGSAAFHFVPPLNFLRNLAGDFIQMDALFARIQPH